VFTFENKNILIVEDQRPFLIILKGLLSNLGAKEIATCENAEKAVSLCRKKAYDIVISDLHLGNKRKNGFELIEELRVQKWLKPHAAFILISADSARPIVLGSVERRPDEFLIKPFSQAQIKSRIVRAWLKRQYLSPIFVCSDKGQHAQAIEVAKTLMKEESPYKHHCLQVLVELYWRTHQHAQAMQLLSSNEKLQSAMWAQIAKAKTQLALDEYQNALQTANGLIKKHRFCVEAYDILAEAQSALDRPDDALNTIQEALKISPFSLDRQFTACRIARDSGDFKLASETCLSIWEQSKRSVYQSSVHWCGYVRSLLDAAEHATEKKSKNSFQQEALLAMQRSRFDEALTRMNDEFDVNVFEELMNARINAIDGKLIEAKRLLANSQFTIAKRYETYPVVYAPDSIHTLLKIGEFEEAQVLIKQAERVKDSLDANSVYTIEQAKNESKKTMGNYVALNKEGIDLYQQGQFSKAKSVFENAQSIAPVNTGVALNLLQCLLKLLSQSDQKRVDPKYVAECRKAYRIIDGMPLTGQHLKKFEALSDDLMLYIQ
jgi:DNA-binding NarL/FixJ family response regulator/Flp pilus assembly protein TadD